MAAVGSLTLCSEDSLAHFLQRFKSYKDCLQKKVDGLVKIGGRNEKDIFRRLLSGILGPPLTQGLPRIKCSSVGVPYTLYLMAVRQRPDLRDVDETVVRITIIEWFHGSRDCYGRFQGKCRDVVHGGFLELLNSEDTEPATFGEFQTTNSVYTALHT